MIEAPAKTRGRPSSRDVMLDAAEAVVMQQGANRLTLDAVARQAGASKGGVLYNFPSKEALLEGLVERLVLRTTQAHQAIIEAQPDEPGRVLKAYVLNSVSDPQGSDVVSGALLAAIAADRKLLAPVQTFFRNRLPQIVRNLPFERAAIVHLATEGLWFMELLQVSPFTPAQRKKIVAALLKMSEAE